MQNRLELFFDYACPYCYRGHRYITELIPDYPQIEIVWRPCESHPRPDSYGPHSDLCIMGMFYAVDNGIDILEYHNRIYRAVHEKRVNIEDINNVADVIHNIVNREDFIETILGDKYRASLWNANHHAFELSGVWAVPAYRINGRRLDSIEDVGVSKKQLKDFLDSAIKNT